MPEANAGAGDGGGKSALVVLGMHRSGTSALSRALSFLGYAQPTDLLAPAPDNPTGFWEAEGVMALNAAILGELGVAWDEPKLAVIPGVSIAVGRDRIGQAIRARHLAAAEAALARSYDGKPLIVIKDPRLCLLTDLWHEALVKSGYRPTYVAIHRHPIEVAQSLRTRNDIGVVRARQLWLHYNLGALAMLARHERSRVVAYADLLTQRHALVERLRENLELPTAPMTVEAAAELDRFLDTGLRHHSLPPAAGDQAPLVPTIVRRLRALLHGWNDMAPEPRRHELAAIAGEFEQHCMFVGNLKAVPGAMEQFARALA